MRERTYLVIASSLLDDIPLRLCDTYDEAITYAQGHPQCWPEGPLKVMGRHDIGDDHPNYIGIVTFERGVPVLYEVVHDWT